MKNAKKTRIADLLTPVILCGAAIVSCCNRASAQEASRELESATLLKSVDGKRIDTGHWSIPTVADIDNDGKRDLIVGQFMNHKAPWLRKPSSSGCSGTATWYRNVAQSDALPSYAAGVDLKSDGGLLYAANW